MKLHGSEIKLTTNILIFIGGIFEYWNKHWIENVNILRDLRPSGPIKLYLNSTAVYNYRYKNL